MSVKRREQSDTKTAKSTYECHVSQTLNVTKHDFKEHWSLIWCDCQWPWSLTPLIVKGLMYITPAKACVNADVIRSEPTCGLVVRKERAMLAKKEDIWPVPMAWLSWARMGFTSGMDTCGHNGKCRSCHLVIWSKNHEYSVISMKDHWSYY